MKLWRLVQPIDSQCALVIRRGTWQYPPGIQGLCPMCNGSRQRRVPPLIAEWKYGPKTGDFSWSAAGEIVITETVRKFLLSRYKRLSAEPVNFLNTRKSMRSELMELGLPGPVTINTDRSSVKKVFACNECGRERYEINDVENVSTRWDKKSQSGLTIRTARVPESGIYITSAELNGYEIFRIKEMPSWAFCTDTARSDIEKAGFTNIGFLEAGDII